MAICIMNSRSHLLEIRIIDTITLLKQNVLGCILKHCKVIGLLKNDIGFFKTVWHMHRFSGDNKCTLIQT